jgi:crossover junction endodeoxyribonuclease RuvC
VRILGLDPGSFHTGYGVLEHRGRRLAALAVGRISSARGQALPERLARLSREARELLLRWQPDLVVVETPFRGINSRSLIVLAEARGALLAAAALHGSAIREFSPAEVKSAVTGNGRAGKDQVARMVRLLLALDGEPLPADATDALAVAICCAQRLAMDSLGRSGGTLASSRK